MNNEAGYLEKVTGLMNALNIPCKDFPDDSGRHFIIQGELGSFTFRFDRGYNHWIVCGPVPLNVAREVHGIPAEHCYIPFFKEGKNPDEWANFLDLPWDEICEINKKLKCTDELELAAAIDQAKGLGDENAPDRYHIIEDMTAKMLEAGMLDKLIIDCYYTTDEGLELLVDILRKHGLIPNEPQKAAA